MVGVCVCVCPLQPLLILLTQLCLKTKYYSNLSQRGFSPPPHPPLPTPLLSSSLSLHLPSSYRARQHAKNVSWLRRTEYISTEYSRPHSSTEGAETKSVSTLIPPILHLPPLPPLSSSVCRVGYSVKKKLQSMDTYKVL